MSVDRTTLIGGPAKATWNGITMMTKSDIIPRLAPTLKAVETSFYGKVDKAVTNRVIKIPILLWGAYQDTSVLFPSSVLNPVIGTRIFGASDLPLVIQAKNGDQVTFHNAQITKLADLFLGVGNSIFAAACEFTAIIKNNTNPETANAYFTVATGTTYSEATTNFSKANYKQQRYSAAWTGVTGLTSFQAKEGWNINWNMELDPFDVDASGTVDMTLMDFSAQAKCIPVGPAMADIEAKSAMQGSALGSLLSAGAANLAITGSGVSVTLNNAVITENGWAFGVKPLRIGEVVWETTVGFTLGVPGARAAVA